MVRCPGNHEFPDHEKNGLDLDFLLLIRCAFLHEFPFFKIKQQVGNCFTRYLQRREKQFPDKQFLYLLRNHSECCIWILKPLQYLTSHMALKKSILGIHDASKHLNREINSQLDQIIFDLGIHDVSRCYQAVYPVYPSPTSRANIRVKPMAKKRVPRLEWRP